MTQLMSTRALAERLDVPINTIYKWRVHGLGPRAVRVGRHLRWTAEEVDRWITDQTEVRDERQRAASKAGR